nr:unnamed protein product [Rangifer tarandus platyrhynchus]
MEAPWEGQEKGLGKREKKPNQDSLQGTRARAWKPGAARRGSTRRELGFLPLGPSEGRRPSERKRPALSPARCPFVTATRPRQPPPPLPEANKSLRAAAAPPSQPPGPGPHLGEQAPARAPAPGPPLTSAGCAAHPPPSAAPTAAEINNLAQKERRRRRGRPGLSGAGFGGKPSFLSSFSSCCSFPPPPNSATPDPLRSSLGPSAANAVSAPADDSGLAGGAEARPQQSRGAGPRLRPRVELSEVCHFERGYGVARKRCRSVSAARGTRQPDTPSGEASGRGGQRRGSAHTYSWPSGSRVPAGPPPPHRLRGPVCTRRARLHPE